MSIYEDTAMFFHCSKNVSVSLRDHKLQLWFLYTIFVLTWILFIFSQNVSCKKHR